MPGLVLNPIAHYGAGKGFQPEPPYVPTYEGVYFAGRDQYYYSGSNLYGDPTRRGGINRTLFKNSGSLDGWVQSINSAGPTNTPLFVRAGGSLREYTLQAWNVESGSIEYKSLLTSNKKEAPLAQIVYQDTFSNTSGDIFGIETSLDEEYAIVYGEEFLRTSNTDTHQSGLAKLPYSTITSSYAGDSTFESNVGSGADGKTIGGSAGFVNAVHINKDKKIGVGHNGKGWSNETSSYQDFVVLNNDGTVDTTFQMPSGSWTDQHGSEFQNGAILAVYYFDNPADGKKRWIVAGGFKKFNNVSYNHILAFDETGSIDTTFNSGGTGFNSYIRNIFKIDDDFMCVVGDFTTYNGSSVYGAAVIRYDGALLNGLSYHDGVRVWDGVYDGTYMYLRGDFKNWTPSGGTSTFVNGIISVQTNFTTVNPNYDIGTGSFVTDTGYSDIFDTGSSQQVEVFLG